MKIYGEIKIKLKGIRAENSDQVIKCYVLTKNLNMYPITNISKRNVYYIENGQETQLKETIVEVFREVSDVYPAIVRLKEYYNDKLQSVYNKLHKVSEIESYFTGFGK